MAKDTISSALGLSDEWFDNKVKSVSDNWDMHEKVSDTILAEAEEVRTESLGDVGFKMSEYELKLVSLGFIIGTKRLHNKHSHEVHFGGDMPEELIAILAKIISQRKMKGED